MKDNRIGDTPYTPVWPDKLGLAFGALYVLLGSLALTVGVALYQSKDKFDQKQRDYQNLPTSQKAVVEKYDTNSNGNLERSELTELMRNYNFVRKPVEVEANR